MTTFTKAKGSGPRHSTSRQEQKYRAAPLRTTTTPMHVNLHESSERSIACMPLSTCARLQMRGQNCPLTQNHHRLRSHFPEVVRNTDPFFFDQVRDTLVEHLDGLIILLHSQLFIQEGRLMNCCATE
jgi:hypothetical protein